MTRVSIIITCYNLGEFLLEAVDSALAQTHPDVEVIVVDDGSTDPATVSLLDSANWPDVVTIRQTNAGLPAARNAGISAATGAYLLPLDADDTFEPTYAAKAAAVLDADREVGIVTARVMLFGTESGDWRPPTFSTRTMLTQNCIVASSMFRKTDWEAAGGYDPQLRLREDHDLWLKILSLRRTVHVLDEPLFNYRQRGASMNASFDRELLVATYARIFRNNLAFYGEHATELMEDMFDKHDDLTDWRYRYGRLQRLIERNERLYSWLRSAYRGAGTLLRRAETSLGRRPSR